MTHYLTRHSAADGPRWACDGYYLPQSLTLSALLELPQAEMAQALRQVEPAEQATAPLLAPLEPAHEVWAAGVTYRRSRDARQAESASADVYTRVYEAERPELFFKATGWRVIAPDGTLRIRQDSAWNVPEPEIVLVINGVGEIVGYCAGNDMSSRSIEGENPLYLPQAKIYDGACALGPGIMLATDEELQALAVRVTITRAGREVFGGVTAAAEMKRSFADLVTYLRRALSFPQGVLLMTGTGIVPPESFTLQPGDVVSVHVGALDLTNTVQAGAF